VEELEAKERLGQRLQSQVEGPCESTKATEYQAGQSKGTIPTYRYLPTVSTGTPTIIKLNASNLAIQYHTQVYDVSNLVGHGAQVR